MAENLAQAIREHEAMARKILADAKAEAARKIAAAQAEAEQAIKTAKQQCHRQWRELVANAEKEAEEKAAGILLKGEAEAKKFYESRQKSAEQVADWLVKEVMSAYGCCRDV